MFENNLLTQINVENPLPTLVEVEVGRSVNAVLKRSFHFFSLLAAERLPALAPLTPYNEEVYLIVNALLERYLITHADTTFTELVFGLRRTQMVGPPSALIRGKHTKTSLWRWLRYICFGPSPMPSAEERAMDYIASTAAAAADTDASVALAREQGALGNLYSDAGGSKGSTDVISTSPAAAEVDGFAEDALLSRGGRDADWDGAGGTWATEEYNASELMSASRSSYGYLKLAPLSKRQRLLSLLLVTLKPYLEKKMKMLYMNETDNTPDAVSLREAYALRYPTRARLLKVFTFVFPILHVTQKSAELLFKLLYLCELTPYTSPFHRMFNLIISRGSVEEGGGVAPKTRRVLTFARLLIFAVLFSYQIFEFSRSAGLSGSALLGDENDGGSLPVPPPPVWGVDVKGRPLSHSRGRGHGRGEDTGADGPQGSANADEEEGAEEENSGEVVPGQCPICKKPITNAAVLSTSGVLGCYPCLQQYVRERHVCPVTHKATSPEQIRRVFEC